MAETLFPPHEVYVGKDQGDQSHHRDRPAHHRWGRIEQRQRVSRGECDDRAEDHLADCERLVKQQP